MSNKISIGIIDDHPLILSGLNELLTKYKDIGSIHSFANSVELFSYLAKSKLDVIIIDIRISKTDDGINISSIIKTKYSSIKIIIYSGFVNQSYILEALKIDVDAYVSKDSPIEEILLAVDSVIASKKYYSKDVLHFTDFHHNINTVAAVDLTEREVEILKLICKGLDYKQIADKLFISKFTVRSHRQNLMIKTKCHNIHDLYQYAIQNNLISLISD